MLAAAAIAAAGVLLGLVVAVLRGPAPLPEAPGPVAAEPRPAPPHEPAPDPAGRVAAPAPVPPPAPPAASPEATAAAAAGAPRSLRGRVVEDPGGAPVAAAVVRPLEATSTRELTAAARTDAAGRFELSLPPVPAVRLHVHTGQHRPLTTGEVPLPAPGTRGEEVVVKVRRGLRVEGRVVDGAGRPLAGAQVGVSDEGGLFVTSDAQGRFAIGGLANGAVNLFAVADGFATGHLAAVRPGRADVELRLLRPSRVTGRIVDPPPTGALDFSVCRPGAGAGGEELCVARRRYNPPHATFSLEDLPAGDHELVIEREGHAAVRLPVKLEPGQTHDLPPIDLRAR